MKTKKLFLGICLLFLGLTATSQETEYFSSVDNTEDYTIAELAKMDPHFSNFLKLFKKSGLYTSAKFVDGFTVLMPVNEAFGDMKVEKLAKLSDPDNKTKLVHFVKNHIIPSKVMAIDFEETQIIDSYGDKEIPISTSGMTGNTVTIGGAQIIQADIKAKDGVIHVIDSFVTPVDDIVIE